MYENILNLLVRPKYESNMTDLFFSVISVSSVAKNYRFTNKGRLAEITLVFTPA